MHKTMSARTYICVPCRWARRAEAAYGLNTDLRCPSCHGSLWELESRWRIPQKTNDKGWLELAAKVAKDSAEIIPRRREAGERKVAEIDRKIANLEKGKSSPLKAEKLKKLRSERDEVRARYE